MGEDFEATWPRRPQSAYPCASGIEKDCLDIIFPDYRRRFLRLPLSHPVPGAGQVTLGDCGADLVICGFSQRSRFLGLECVGVMNQESPIHCAATTTRPSPGRRILRLPA